MNASTDIVLTVGPCPGFPRRLWISWSTLSVAAAVYPEDPLVRRFALAHAFRPDTVLRRHDRIQLDVRTSTLWIGGTSFDLAPGEVQQIRDRFEPLGLTIKFNSPSPVAPSTPTDHEAAQPFPLGERGMTPVTVLDGAGTLVPYARTAARVLTANEVY